MLTSALAPDIRSALIIFSLSLVSINLRNGNLLKRVNLRDAMDLTPNSVEDVYDKYQFQ